MISARFTADDAQRAHDTWGANCGPGALAAILGLTLDEVRPHMGDFERKGYTNPTLMFSALRSIGARWGSKAPTQATGISCWPTWGLCRVQWEGPWTKPGVPIAARYRHTHWIGASQRHGSANVGIFDINCIGNGTGWASLDDWNRVVVPWVLRECVPRADGRWHLTHVIEVDRPALLDTARHPDHGAVASGMSGQGDAPEARNPANFAGAAIEVTSVSEGDA